MFICLPYAVVLVQNTFIGLPQMKAYNSINIRFMFRTFETNGLLLYNAGKASDFIAVELIEGKLRYSLNLGYGHISITVVNSSNSVNQSAPLHDLLTNRITCLPRA